MKKTIKLTESELKGLISESIKKILSELDWKTYQNAANKDRNPKRAKEFSDMARDRFNDQYEYEDDKGNMVKMDPLSPSDFYSHNRLLVSTTPEKPSPYAGKKINISSPSTNNHNSNEFIAKYPDGSYTIEDKPFTSDKRHARKIQKAYDDFESYRNNKSEYKKGSGWKEPEQNDFHDFLKYK